MKATVPQKYLIYADDDHDDRQIMADMMAKIDPTLEVIVVENGRGVLNYLHLLVQDDILPCFILLDINMPVMNGFKTLEELKSKEAFKNIPVILFTTSNHPRDIQLSESLGADKFLVKPFSLDQIAEVTQEFANLCHALPVKRRETIAY